MYLGLTVINNHFMLTKGDNPFLNFLFRITNISKMNNIFNLLLSILIILSFKRMKVFTNKYINIVAKSTLGVYLIHDSMFTRAWLWSKVCKNASFQTSSYLIIHSVYIIPLVYICCTIIDIVYTYTIEHFINIFIQWLNTKCLYKIDDFYNKLSTINNNNHDNDTNVTITTTNLENVTTTAKPNKEHHE